jgi:hypothetical protein
MKKLLTFLVFGLIISVSASAQTFAILNAEGEVITGTTIIVPIQVNGEVEVDIKVRNLSSSQVSAKISKTFTEGPVDGSFNTMCSPVTNNSGGACTPSATTPTFILDPNETSGIAAIHFEQGSNPGVSTCRYKVYNTANESDFVYVIFTYSTLTSVATSFAADFTVFPNPAVNIFNIQHSYGPKAVVEIFNVLGKLLQKLILVPKILLVLIVANGIADTISGAYTTMAKLKKL